MACCAIEEAFNDYKLTAEIYVFHVKCVHEEDSYARGKSLRIN